MGVGGLHIMRVTRDNKCPLLPLQIKVVSLPITAVRSCLRLIRIRSTAVVSQRGSDSGDVPEKEHADIAG